MRARLVLSATITALVVTTQILPVAAAGTAGAVRCGDTITVDTVLTRDLRCSGDGLVLSGEDVTLDLNGHVIRGPGTGLGVNVSRGGNAVTNGTVRGFARGVLADTASLIEDAVLVDNDIGVNRINPGDPALLRDSVVRNNGFGVLISWGEVKVVNSTFFANTTGFSAHTDSPQRVSSSTFHRNGIGIDAFDGNLIVQRNTFRDNGTAMHVDFTNATITDNRIRGGDVGLRVLWSARWGADIRRNTIVGARVGAWLTAGTAWPSLPDTSVLTGNVFRANHEVGLIASGPVQISGNTFQGNGFAPSSPSAEVAGARLDDAVVTGNRAIRNAGYGIEAHDSADGGGNIGRANGNPEQCLGVDCR